MEEKLKRSRILIIDDDADARSLLRLALRKIGFKNISDTDCPLSGLSKMEWGTYDIVLLDWIMPQLKGIDVLKTIRRVHADLPVIMVTSEDSRAQVVEAMEAGVTDYVIKPFKPFELVEKVTRALINREREHLSDR